MEHSDLYLRLEPTLSQFQEDYRPATDADIASLGYVRLDGIDIETVRRMLEAWPTPSDLTPMQRMTHDDLLRDVARKVVAAFDRQEVRA